MARLLLVNSGMIINYAFLLVVREFVGISDHPCPTLDRIDPLQFEHCSIAIESISGCMYQGEIGSIHDRVVTLERAFDKQQLTR